jgi:hypothetical protein
MKSSNSSGAQGVTRFLNVAYTGPRIGAVIQLDPYKVCVIGFSAGGHLVAVVSTHFAQRTYAPADAADKLSCRPDFAIALNPRPSKLPIAQWPRLVEAWLRTIGMLAK